jgi:methionine-rich copper-binding protein CopC
MRGAIRLSVELTFPLVFGLLTACGGDEGKTAATDHPEFLVNTWTTYSQGYPRAASFSDEGFLVVWQSWTQDGSDFGVYGQRFDKDGNKVGLEFQVNTWTTGDQQYPSVAALSDGGFVVVWESVGQDRNGYGVYGQRFDKDGNKVGLEFQVNTWTTGDQRYPSVAALSDGGFVVVWESVGQDGSGYGVYGQRFDKNGGKLGDEFRVNTWTIDCQWFPSIASLADGGFVVVWESVGQDGDGYGVYGQKFDKDGKEVGSEFQVNTWTIDYQWFPSIASLAKGGFVVVWQSLGQDGGGNGVYGRIFPQ